MRSFMLFVQTMWDMKSHGGEYVGYDILGCDTVVLSVATSVLEERITSNFDTEVGGDMFLRNENHLQDYTQSQSRRS
jgi:hypothetical protein